MVGSIGVTGLAETSDTTASSTVKGSAEAMVLERGCMETTVGVYAKKKSLGEKGKRFTTRRRGRINKRALSPRAGRSTAPKLSIYASSFQKGDPDPCRII